jgi:hypothetical protein
VVLALDITHDPRHGFNSYEFADKMLATKPNRLRYVISNRRIAGDADFVKENPHYRCPGPWQWGHYDGDNPHDHHVHFSAVHDQKLYDDEGEWDLSGAPAPIVTPDTPTPVKEPVLDKGAKGPAVAALQHLLGIEADGNFGPGTEKAVIAFQKSRGLVADGSVGPATWKALKETPITPSPTPTPAPEVSSKYDNVAKLAAEHAVAKHQWRGRGSAPIGYTKGLAVSFAAAVERLQNGDSTAIEMAKANTGNDDRDALSWYNSKFAVYNFSNAKDGIDTLRHLFVLLMGLGMRESSGNYCEGLDYSAGYHSASQTEAGLFQQSWNSYTCSKELPKLIKSYSGDGFLTYYRQGVSCSSKQLKNWGTGDGLTFQRLCKSRPDFAVLCAGVGVRNLRKAWGPLNRREVEINPQADDLFMQIQNLMGGVTS